MDMTPEEMAAMGDGALIYGVGPFAGLIMAMALAVSVVCFWRIFAKAGYGGAWGLLALFPPLQILLLLFLALAAWPGRDGPGDLQRSGSARR